VGGPHGAGDVVEELTDSLRGALVEAAVARIPLSEPAQVYIATVM
jgi:hypothetical protein